MCVLVCYLIVKSVIYNSFTIDNWLDTRDSLQLMLINIQLFDTEMYKKGFLKSCTTLLIV